MSTEEGKETHIQNSAADFQQSLFRRRTLLNSDPNMANMSPMTRDYDAQFGYPAYIDKYTYQRMYDRSPVANRVVQLFPLECWQQIPEIYDSDAPTQSDFEKKINALFVKLNMWGMLRRIDIMSGIGCYGVLLMGVGDGKPLSEPVTECAGGYDVQFVRPFSHSQVEIIQSETDVSNPRYGHPTMYQIQFQKYDQQEVEGGFVDYGMKPVHWTRIVHVADNREVSEIYGVPRLQRCFNALLDLQKIFGSSGEMFYKGAYPGYIISATDNVLGSVDIDTEGIREQLELFENNLQRWMAVKNAQVTSLSSQYGDPSGHVEVCLNQIAIANGVPIRILLGSERGELSSNQDAVLWSTRLAERQASYLTPFLIRPVVLRLIHYGAIPAPYNGDFTVKWPDTSVSTEEDRYLIREKQVDLLIRYAENDLNRFFSPVDYMIQFCDMTEAEAKAFLADSERYNNEQVEKEAAGIAGLDGEAAFELGGGETGGFDDLGGDEL